MPWRWPGNSWPALWRLGCLQGGWRADPWVLALLALGAALVLTSLGNGRLWQDEAETAVLGKNTLAYGYPRAFDGRNRLNPSLPVQEGYAWTYHSWLPMYLAATSFLLFGADTVSARLPFALLGVVCFWLGYRVARRLTQDSLIACLTSLLLITSVPLILHLRQCRYYAPAVLFTLWVVWAYWRFLHDRRWAGPELVFASNLLFHSDHGVFIPVTFACGLHYLWHAPRLAERGPGGYGKPGVSRDSGAGKRPQARGESGVSWWYRGLAVALIVLATVVPWAVYLKAAQHRGAWEWVEIRHHLEFYFRQINRFIVPVIFWALMLLAFRPSVRDLFGPRGSRVRRAWGLVGLLLGIGLAFLILVPEQRHFRYLLFLIPWLLLSQAAFLAKILRSPWRRAGVALAGILIFTDLVHYSGTSLLAAQIPGVRRSLSSPDVRVRSLVLEFLGELRTPYRGPVDGIVEYLHTHGRPGQTVKTPSAEDHPLIFYTELTHEPLASLEEFSRESYPDWIVIRRDWVPAGFFESPYFRRIEARYRKILLDAPDIPWQNRPDPGYHRFRTDTRALPVVVYQRQW